MVVSQTALVRDLVIAIGQGGSEVADLQNEFGAFSRFFTIFQNGIYLEYIRRVRGQDVLIGSFGLSGRRRARQPLHSLR